VKQFIAIIVVFAGIAIPSASFADDLKAREADLNKRIEKVTEKEQQLLEKEKLLEDEIADDEIAPYRIRYGAHIGISLANAVTDPPQNSSNRSGLTLGLKATKAVIAGLLSVQTELNYVQKGAQNSHFGSPGAVKADYIEIPLLAKVELMLPRFRPYAVVGPGFGFALTKSVESVAGIGGTNLRPFDFTGSIGFGCAILSGKRLDSSQWTIEGRYTNSFVNLTPDHGNWKNSVFQILVGIQI
jgi:hypothetical protein